MEENDTGKRRGRKLSYYQSYILDLDRGPMQLVLKNYLLGGRGRE